MNNYGKVGVYLGLAAASLTFIHRQNSDSKSPLANRLSQHYIPGMPFGQSEPLLPKFPFEPSYIKDYIIPYKPKSSGIEDLLNEAMNKVSESMEEIKTRDRIYAALLNGNNREAERIAGSRTDLYEMELYHAQKRTEKFLRSVEWYEKQTVPLKGVSAFDILGFLIEKKDINNARIPELLEVILETVKSGNITFGAFDFSALDALQDNSSGIVRGYLNDIRMHFGANYADMSRTSVEIIQKNAYPLILGDIEKPNFPSRTITPIINNIANNLRSLQKSGLYKKEELADLVLPYYWDSYWNFESDSNHYINDYLYPEIKGKPWFITFMSEYPEELGLADLLTIGMWAEDIQPGITFPIHFRLQQISSLERLAKIPVERGLLFKALMIMARRGNLQGF